MSCNLTREEIQRFNIKFDNQLCQAYYRDASGQHRICGCLLTEHLISHSTDVAPPPALPQVQGDYSTTSAPIHLADIHAKTASNSSVLPRGGPPPSTTPPLGLGDPSALPNSPISDAVGSSDMTVDFKMEAHVVLYVTRFIGPEVAKRIDNICPGATVHFEQRNMSITLTRLSAQGPRSQSEMDELVIECSNVIGPMVRSVCRKPKRMPQIRGLTAEMLAADSRLRALEEASRVLCLHTDHSPPAVDLVYLKSSPDSWVLMEGYLRSLEVITELWPLEDGPLSEGRMLFVQANIDFCRSQVSQFGASLDVRMDQRKCHVTGESANVHRALSFLSGIVCLYTEVSSSDPAAMDAVLHTLAVLERNNQSGHGLPGSVSVNPLQMEWSGGIGNSMGLVKVFRNNAQFLFASIPEFRHSLKLWHSHVAFLIRNFRREQIGPMHRPVNVQTVKNAFGLFACDFNPSTKMLSLVGVKDRVQCAKQQCPLLGDGATGNMLRTYRVSCACMGGDTKLIAKHLRLNVNGEISQAEELVATVNKSRFGGDKVVSACVAGIDSGVCDDAVLVLHGHVSVVNEALTMVVRALRMLTADIVQEEFPFKNKQLMAWVVHSHVLDELNESVIIESSVGTAPPAAPHPSPPGFGPLTQPVAATVAPSAGEPNGSKPLLGKYVVHDRNVFVGNMDFLTAVETYCCDSLVNSVNPKLDHSSGGMAKVVAKFAGPDFEQSCCTYVNSMPQQCLMIGTAHYFPSFLLGQKGLRHILNTLIPRNPNGFGTPAMKQDFFNAIKMALTKASEQGSLGVAVPGIGTGDYGWPANEATMLTVQAVEEWLADFGGGSSIQSVVFLDLNQQVAEAYGRALNAIAPNLLAVSPVDKYGEVEEHTGHPMLPEYQWYWHAGPDNIPGMVMLEFGGQQHGFVPYNYDHLMQIEDAYIRQQGSVTLSISGSNTRYRLDFAGTVQVNEHNGGTRRICRKKMDPAHPPPLYSEKLRAYEQSIGHAGSVYSAHHAVGSADLATLALKQSAIVDYVFSYSHGLTVVGASWKVKAAVDALKTALETATRPIIKSLRILSGVRSLTFPECLAALSSLLAPSGYSVTAEDECNWTVEISAIGEDAINCAENAFERAIVDIFCGRVTPVHSFS